MPFVFDPIYRTDNRAARRGLEQILHDRYEPPLNGIGGIDPNNPNRQRYLAAARAFLRRLRGGM
jgi:hypothetical protein